MKTGLTTAYVAGRMRASGYLAVEGAPAAVTGGGADSRRVQPGDLFTAFHGDNVDGNDFVRQAFASGAVAAICERGPERVASNQTVVVAPDTTSAMHDLASAWRRECSPRVVGITGTVGKTTAKELTAAALRGHFVTHSSPGNLNSREGLPLALMSLRPEHEVSVLEMGMDSPGEMAELCAVAAPEVGVVLNIGLTHVSKLGSIEAIEREKLSLARSLPSSGTAVLNAADPRVGAAAASLRCRVWTFGQADGADIRHGPVLNRGLEGTQFDVTFEGRTVEMRNPLPGEHVVPAALAAAGVGLALGMSLDEVASAIGEAEVDGRMRVMRTADGVIILDDRYNASPASLAGALRLLFGLPGRHVALIGVMAELGEFEEEEHRQIGRVAARCCDLLFAVGEPCRALVEEARAAGLQEAHWFSARDEAAVAAAKALRPGDHVLVKASRSQAFETILPLLGKPS